MPFSLINVEKRANLVAEINAPLIQGNSQASLGVNIMLKDLDAKEKDRRLDDTAQISMTYLTEQLDIKLRENILLRLWTGCMEAAKAIRFSYAGGGIRDGVVTEAPITHEYRRALFASLIDPLSKVDLVYAAGVEVAPVYKKLVKEYYSFAGVPPNSIVRRYSNEYQKE